jgi:Uma2 family endonuclease
MIVGVSEQEILVDAVTSVTREFLAQRWELEQDKWDEVWDGVLHLMPPPHMNHQRLLDQLGFFFLQHWEHLGLGKTSPDTGVKRPGAGLWKDAPGGEKVPDDYRTPDRVWLCPERYGRVQGGWVVGGPDVVLEIVSPGQRCLQKLPFYFEVGVREVLLIWRDSRQVKVLRRGASDWEEAPVGPDGWVPSLVLDAELRTESRPDEVPALHLRRISEPERSLTIGA